MEAIKPSEEQLWASVVARDAGADGTFVFGVLSTGIYCRPSCPARRPLRKNVRFFETPDSARSVGLRACLRCSPDRDMSPKCDLVQTVCQFIESHRGQPVSLQMLADWAGVSRFHLQRTFKDATGLSPREYAQAARLSNFKAGVRTGMTLAEARIESGLSDTRQLGMAPKIYKRQGFGETIRFAIGTCRFGMIAVASTAQGICSVQFGNSADELWEAIKGEFVNAKVIEDEESVSTQLQSVIDLAEGKLRTLDLPRDIRATAFQQLVWNYLIDIPRGETRTYQEVANGIERPASVRAVANACGANPVALVVPCHRVVRSDGSQGGYRWGTEVKSAILRHERDRQ